nr:DUF234 domain-containing protein [Enterococcus mediterraneensis]
MFFGSLFSFHKFVFQNKELIERGDGFSYAKRRVLPLLSDFVGKPAFEESALDYLVRKNSEEELPLIATFFGAWWGNDPVKKIPTDVDVVVADEIDKKNSPWRMQVAK